MCFRGWGHSRKQVQIQSLLFASTYILEAEVAFIQGPEAHHRDRGRKRTVCLFMVMEATSMDEMAEESVYRVRSKGAWDGS